MGYNTEVWKKERCPHCKKVIYLNYILGTWEELKSRIGIYKNDKRRKR